MTKSLQSQPTKPETCPQKKSEVTPAAPRLSVIICTYNRRTMVLATLASLRRQTLAYELFEVIVVDNDSLDETFSRTLAYVHAGNSQEKTTGARWQVKCLQEPRNGLAYARETALKAATGDIAVFLHDDTLVDPYYLEHLLEAYKATGADAICGRVNLRWEAPRPYWLGDNLLAMLGYFNAGNVRAPLGEHMSLSSCCFSVKIKALHSISTSSYVSSPLLSKRLNAPTTIAIDDISQRLRKGGYSLWYEPAALVMHRISAARLQRAFFTGRTYWQGRAEILANYLENSQCKGRQAEPLSHILKMVGPELRQIAYLTFIAGPLLVLRYQSSYKRLLVEMEKARLWGRVWQQLQSNERAPKEMQTLHMLLVHSGEKNAEFLARGLRSQGIHYVSSQAKIGLRWLWRQRPYLGQAVAVVHVYRPGTFQLTIWQRLRFLAQLWLARCLGIRITSSDGGGWWQSMQQIRFRVRRVFEQKVFAHSDIVFAHTRAPEELYPDPAMQNRICCLPHPGLHGYYPRLVAQAEARRQLGLCDGSFVFVCLANMHTEREVLHLLAAFSEVAGERQAQAEGAVKSAARPQLVIAGSPRDRLRSKEVLRQAALNSDIHLFLEPADKQEISKEDFVLYIGVANAVVLPHFALPEAGTLETAMLFLSYERIVVAPDLPRFRDMMSSKACVLYKADDSTALVQALRNAQKLESHLSKQEIEALEIENGWKQYAKHMLKAYQKLLPGSL